MPKPGSGGEEVAREESAAAVLAGLLPRAVASPRQVATSDGGAVLVVALHCLMARAGFLRSPVSSLGTDGESSESTPSVYALAVTQPLARLHASLAPLSLGASWNNGRHENAWMIEYTREDAPGTFVLNCSLAHGMMIVCGTEVGNPDNFNMASLRLPKYVPELVRCRQRSWSGVFDNEEVLVQTFTELVTGPLAAKALRPREPSGAPFALAGNHGTAFWAAAALLAAAAAGATALAATRRST